MGGPGGGTGVDGPGGRRGVGGPGGGTGVDGPGGGRGVGDPGGRKGVGDPGGCGGGGGGGVPIPRAALHLAIPSTEWDVNLFREDGRNSPDVSRGLVAWTLFAKVLHTSRWDTVRLVESGCSILKVNCVDLHG